eukprot:8451631-Heterocapsa_arctica.AAC.1
MHVNGKSALDKGVGKQVQKVLSEVGGPLFEVLFGTKGRFNKSLLHPAPIKTHETLGMREGMGGGSPDARSSC